MVEQTPRKETASACFYHGDTLENFLVTAWLDEGITFVNKSHHPTITFSEVFFERGNREFPIVKAIDKAFRLGHIPVVLQANLYSCRKTLTRFPDRWFSLPANIPFSVGAVWIPNPDFDLNTVDISLSGWSQNRDEVMRQFVPVSPIELLSIA